MMRRLIFLCLLLGIVSPALAQTDDTRKRFAEPPPPEIRKAISGSVEKPAVKPTPAKKPAPRKKPKPTEEKAEEAAPVVLLPSPTILDEKPQLPPEHIPAVVPPPAEPPAEVNVMPDLPPPPPVMPAEPKAPTPEPALPPPPVAPVPPAEPVTAPTVESPTPPPPPPPAASPAIPTPPEPAPAVLPSPSLLDSTPKTAPPPVEAPAAAKPAKSVQTSAPVTPVTSASSYPDLRIVFQPTETALPLSVKADVDKIAAQAVADADARVTLVAYAAAGGDQSTMARRVSLSRALAVRAYLIDKGINSLRINVQAEGDKNPDGGEPDRVDIFIKSGQ